MTWRVVPEEPTREMLDALAAALDVGYLEASDEGPQVVFNPRAAWKAAVKVAPKRTRARLAVPGEEPKK